MQVFFSSFFQLHYRNTNTIKPGSKRKQVAWLCPKVTTTNNSCFVPGHGHFLRVFTGCQARSKERRNTGNLHLPRNCLTQNLPWHCRIHSLCFFADKKTEKFPPKWRILSSSVHPTCWQDTARLTVSPCVQSVPANMLLAATLSLLCTHESGIHLKKCSIYPKMWKKH